MVVQETKGLDEALKPLFHVKHTWLGRQPYEMVWQQLQAHAEAVASFDAKEIIFSCEHDPVYTTGRRGVDNRLADVLGAPVIQSDRGGEMTFHGPGQVMLYPVIHLRARHLGVKAYVSLLEQSCIDMLQGLNIAADRRCGFPGVWTEQGKIAALGVRVRRGVAYHGMALNVDVDPAWFAAIKPCGLPFSAVSMAVFGNVLPLSEIAGLWHQCLQALLNDSSKM